MVISLLFHVRHIYAVVFVLRYGLSFTLSLSLQLANDIKRNEFVYFIFSAFEALGLL